MGEGSIPWAGAPYLGQVGEDGILLPRPRPPQAPWPRPPQAPWPRPPRAPWPRPPQAAGRGSLAHRALSGFFATSCPARPVLLVRGQSPCPVCDPRFKAVLRPWVISVSRGLLKGSLVFSYCSERAVLKSACFPALAGHENSQGLRFRLVLSGDISAAALVGLWREPGERTQVPTRSTCLADSKHSINATASLTVSRGLVLFPNSLQLILVRGDNGFLPGILIVSRAPMNLI